MSGSYISRTLTIKSEAIPLFTLLCLQTGMRGGNVINILQVLYINKNNIDVKIQYQREDVYKNLVNGLMAGGYFIHDTEAD